MYKIETGIPVPERKAPVMSVVPYDNNDLMSTTFDVFLGKQQLVIPEDGGPEMLNDINIAAYTLLDVAVLRMRPKDIKFVAHLTDMQSITKAQRSRLAALFETFVGRKIASN
jgi:hypothetical protein